ncbi:HD domain-containing phosphohydrolase [uncultured Photobacterium sp.]|uniref:HD-GYP domain-containing protein n=1 Tax=uncultured Photobacterium sp. TaxID=173973 RepID=UPI002608E1FF|nr:HD domain-containing phosphohydrolase [uncultured Photobacterium sp.]
MNGLSGLHIDLRQVIIAIEAAVSLVGMDDTNHGKRVGYIASQLGKQLGFNEQSIQFSFDLGLLHDCGVSTAQMHSYLVNNFNGNDAHIHCEAGYRLLKDFEPLSKFATPILYHHTPWEELKKLDLSSHDVIMANLIFLSDRIDVMAATHYKTDFLCAREKVVKSIIKYAGTLFAPSLIKAFQQLAMSEVFWIALEERHITRYTWDMGQFERSQLLTIAQLKQLSLILAYIVDQRRPFTAQHSIKVARLARYIASAFGLQSEQCDKIEIAGLLHAVGKLYISDDIVEMPGTLSDVELSIMKQHSYETYEILRHIKGLGEIARWAAFHHEGGNGVGYPFHPEEKDLSIEARIIAVADVFQALVQGRPYQDGTPLTKVIDILDELTTSGKLDQDIVNLTKKHKDACFDIAKENNARETACAVETTVSEYL